MAITIKTQEQIDAIKQASILAAQTVKYLGQFAVAGNTTSLIDKKCKEFVSDHKAIPASLNYKGFPGSLCTSVNDVICHGIPSALVLKEGDILNLDVAVILNGYFGDTCSMFAIGEINEPAKKIIDIAKECLRIGIGECQSGNHLGNIGFEINRYAKANGCSVVYEFCGHGVGLKFHEEPEVSHVNHIRNDGPILKPGMIFTIEPMINLGKARAKVDRKDGWTARTIDGKLSAQFEHTICISSTIPDVLTDIEDAYPKPISIF